MSAGADGQPRETPLAAKLKARIRREGAMSVAGFMQACLSDPEHGYYTRQPAIGAAGDFVTAPEISQVFGELVGLWCAVVWQQMGSPQRLNLVELGPGRGTMMRDALRAAKIVPGFRDAVAVHLVESNATLRAVQQQTLADAHVPVVFHGSTQDALSPGSPLSERPALIIANEYLDTLPVTQSIFADGEWRSRKVALEGDDFSFAVEASEPCEAPDGLGQLVPKDGDVLEACSGHGALAAELAARSAAGALAALFIDYGHARTGFGDTLQGVAGQAHVSPFHAPGETDLSAQVDFQRFADQCRLAGLAVDGPLPQAEFLGRLGVVERASRLMSANPSRAAEIEAGVARLIAPQGMGSRFLAIGVRSAGLAPLPGFAG